MLARFTLALSAATILGFASPLPARVAVTYTGPAGDVWHNPANWTPAVIPDNNTSAMTPIFYTVDIDRNVVIAGSLFDIAGMNNGGSVDTFTSWDFVAGIGAGAPFLHNTGTLSITPAATANAYLGIPIGQVLTVSGGGVIDLGGAGLARVLGGGVLVNQDNLIRGEGTLGEGVVPINNMGVIASTAADDGGVGTLALYPAGMVNANTIVARNNSNLTMRGLFQNGDDATIIAEDGGTIHFVGGATVDSGTITSGANGTIIVSSTTRWESINHSGHTLVPSTLVLVDIGIINDGSIEVSGNLQIETDSGLQVILDGNGTILLNGGVIGRTGMNDASLGNYNDIIGHGLIGEASLTVINNDVIRANGGTLAINPGNDFFGNLGTLTADGGTLALRGGVYLNGGGTILANNSIVRLEGADVSGGSLLSLGTGEFVVPFGNRVKLRNSVSIFARISDFGGLDLSGLIGGNGIITTNSTRMNAIGTVVFNETLRTIMKPGSTVGAGAGSFGEGAEGSAAEFVNNGTISGAGTIGLNQLQITNNGTIRGDGGGTGLFNALTLDPSPDGLTNAGIIEATDLGQVILNGNGGGSFLQAAGSRGDGGVIRAADPTSNVHIFNNAHVSGGQLGAGAGSISAAAGTIRLEDLINNANLVALGVSTLQINQNVTNNGTMTTPAVGTLMIAAGATLAGSGAINNNGSLVVAGGGTLDVNTIEGTNGRLVAQSGGTLQMDSIRQASLTIQNNATATLKSSATPNLGGSLVNNLNIGSMNGVLDITNRGMAVDYPGANPFATIRDWITTGHAGGAWTGFGIRSSSAAATPGFGIGYAEAAAVGLPTTFLGRPIDASTVLFRYTLLGDADLNAVVNINDFARLAANFNTAGPWSKGDFNYDQMTTIQDFALLAGNFNRVLAANVNPRGVPEPEMIGALLAFAAALKCHRRATRFHNPR